MRQPSLCDFKDCKNTVENERKVTLCRMNPWEPLFRFHACDACVKNLGKCLTEVLRSEYGK